MKKRTELESLTSVQLPVHLVWFFKTGSVTGLELVKVARVPEIRTRLQQPQCWYYKLTTPVTQQVRFVPQLPRQGHGPCVQLWRGLFSVLEWESVSKAFMAGRGWFPKLKCA